MIIVASLVGIFLAIGSIFDWKEQSLPAKLLAVGGFLGAMGCVYLHIYEDRVWMEVIKGVLPGVACLGLARVTANQVGYGDGMVLIVIGSCLGWECTLNIIWISLLGTFVVSVALLLLRKGNRNTRLPFIPFLLASYLIVMGGKPV